MNGEIKRMTIEAFADDKHKDKVGDFTVMFNPNNYAQKYELSYHERQGQGDTASPQIFGKIKPQEYAFEFMIDGTGVTTDSPKNVPEEIKKFLTLTGKNNGEIHRPNYLKISWGTLLVKCVLKSAEISYSLFKPDGTPLRAKIKAIFSENVEDTLRVAEARNSSPDLTHRRVVKQGDTLPLMTANIYGDETYYLQVAAFNNLRNFRNLHIGQVLLFPPVKQRTA